MSFLIRKFCFVLFGFSEWRPPSAQKSSFPPIQPRIPRTSTRPTHRFCYRALSTLPHNHGYTPAADPRTPGAHTWADKDFLSNVMGLHHFHLGLTMEGDHVARTNEVLFASVTRDEFEILGLFDHAAFEYEDDGTMTPERVKLWKAFQARQEAGALPGQLMIGGYANLGITLSSQPAAVVFAAQRHVAVIQDVSGHQKT